MYIEVHEHFEEIYLPKSAKIWAFTYLLNSYSRNLYMLTLNTVSLSFGSAKLLDEANLTIHPGERICLIGRNGEGKSSLLKLIAGSYEPDSGIIEKAQGLNVAMLSQEINSIDQDITVFELVAKGLGALGQTIIAYQSLLATAADAPNDKRFTELQHQIDAAHGWDAVRIVETVISKVSLTPDVKFQSLSGGLKRRALLAQSLVTNPDLLLLDEPTNHLDIDAILWLEKFLLGYQKTLLFVTHDRSFLQRLATRIIELDRGQLSSYDCDYQTYLKRKEALLLAQEKEAALFDKKLAQEEAWIRQGIKARRTRNEGRVRALEKMRVQRKQRRELPGMAKMATQDGERSGKVVIEASHVSFSYGDKKIINDFSCLIMCGDKVGIIGPNGCGKTTLLNILLAKFASSAGKIKLGTQLEIAYLDQMRGQLNPEQSVVDNLAQGKTEVIINGKAKHVISYLKDFLFAPERANSPVKVLSGGERNRLLLAKLFSKPANLLVLDEPTNDLDIETLELLEALLVEFSGTVLLVSHDRAFLDNVVSSTIVYEGNGQFNEYVGGYEDWLRQRPKQSSQNEHETDSKAKLKPKSETRPNKLSYKEQRELQQLPVDIEDIEAQIQGLQARMAAPDFYQQPPTIVADAHKQLHELQSDLDKAYQRWEALLDKS